MTETIKWRTDGVKIVRAELLNRVMFEPSGTGRATAFDFAGIGGRETWIGTVAPETWIGTVALQPHAKTGRITMGVTRLLSMS